MPAPQPEVVTEIQKVTEYIKYKIPDIYLSECVQPSLMGTDKMEDLLLALQANAKKYRHCMLVHNELIELLKEQR